MAAFPSKTKLCRSKRDELLEQNKTKIQNLKTVCFVRYESVLLEIGELEIETAGLFFSCDFCDMPVNLCPVAHDLIIEFLSVCSGCEDIKKYDPPESSF